LAQDLDNDDASLIDIGVQAAGSPIFQENKIWARYSDEKADVAETLANILRTLCKETPLLKPLRVLSIGSGAEPQFRLLQASFRGGVYLYDIDRPALDAAEERIARQNVKGVVTVHGDYTEDFVDRARATTVLREKLGGQTFDLMTLHHALYYSDERTWTALIETLSSVLLAPMGAIHAALMSASTLKPFTSTALYNQFAGQFFGQSNRQDLLALGARLQTKAREPSSPFSGDRFVSKTSEVSFFVDDFEAYMAVIWMIMLYPSVHEYSDDQKRQITRYVLANYWRPRRRLVQVIDHLVLYRGLTADGLI